jgi:acetyl-CoA C-acetyltransferase
MEPVSIVGWAQTVHEKSKSDQNYAELVYEAVQSLMKALSISYSDIETVISASSDFSDGRTISNMAIQDVVGTPLKSESKVSMDGAFALMYGYARVASGAFGTCLVVAHGKLSEGDSRLIANAAWDPIFLRPLGLEDHTALGLQARRYLDRHHLDEGLLSDVAAFSYAASSENIFAHRREVYTSQAVHQSPLIADPLRVLHVAPESDGACAVLLASKDRSNSFTSRPIWLKGVGSCYDVHSPGQRDLAESTALRKAAREAYGRAGITNPAKDLNLAEVIDLSSCQTMLWAEEMGFCPAGQGGEWILSQRSLAYNRSGGALAANPGFATGLVRVAEVAQRLSMPDQRPLTTSSASGGSGGGSNGPIYGLAHGMTGYIGQAHCVWILST